MHSAYYDTQHSTVAAADANQLAYTARYIHTHIRYKWNVRNYQLDTLECNKELYTHIYTLLDILLGAGCRASLKR